MFNFKKQVQSEEYEKITNKFTDLQAEFRALESKISSLQTTVDDLRGKFNRKLSGIKKDDEENKEESKSLNRFSPFN